MLNSRLAASIFAVVLCVGAAADAQARVGNAAGTEGAAMRPGIGPVSRFGEPTYEAACSSKVTETHLAGPDVANGDLARELNATFSSRNADFGPKKAGDLIVRPGVTEIRLKIEEKQCSLLRGQPRGPVTKTEDELCTTANCIEPTLPGYDHMGTGSVVNVSTCSMTSGGYEVEIWRFVRQSNGSWKLVTYKFQALAPECGAIEG